MVTRTWIALCACAWLAALALPEFALAQGCTAHERSLLAARRQRAEASLMTEGARAFAQVMTLDPGLSAACRQQQARLNPVTVACTTSEKETILAGYEAILAAAARGDVGGLLDALEEMRDALSPGCWVASNYHQDPRVQAACSDAERRTMAESTDNVIAGLRRLLLLGDANGLLEALAVFQRLSPSCQQALVATQQPPVGSSGGTGPYRAPGGVGGGVQDHGGGVYVVPGAGACTPSGCMAF